MKNILLYIIVSLAVIGCHYSEKRENENQNRFPHRNDASPEEFSNQSIKFSKYLHSGMGYNLDTLIGQHRIILQLENKYLIRGKRNRMRINIEDVRPENVLLATNFKEARMENGESAEEFIFDVKKNAQKVTLAILLADTVDFHIFFRTELNLKTK